jgi:hypothetical protein
MVKLYSVNENFFQEDTEASFYVAGFIAADGCLEREFARNRYRVTIEINFKDEPHLKLMQMLMASTHKINTRTRIDSRFAAPTQQSSLRISSKTIYDSLERFNIRPNKSKTYTIPSWMVAHPLKQHFLRGIFDGDGSVGIKSSDCKNRKEYLRFSLTGTLEELKSFNAILVDECNIEPNQISKAAGCYVLEYGKNESTEEIFNFLYKDSTIYLSRKREIVDRFLLIAS